VQALAQQLGAAVTLADASPGVQVAVTHNPAALQHANPGAAVAVQ
jgi:hypothetical protein